MDLKLGPVNEDTITKEQTFSRDSGVKMLIINSLLKVRQKLSPENPITPQEAINISAQSQKISKIQYLFLLESVKVSSNGMSSGQDYEH